MFTMDLPDTTLIRNRHAGLLTSHRARTILEPLDTKTNYQVETAMSVFEHAMQMETDGRDYYLKHAEEQTHPALKKILLELADDELKHFRI